MQVLKMRDVLLNNTMILLMFTTAGLAFLFTIYRRIKRKEMVSGVVRRRAHAQNQRFCLT